jgi:hypothetical protein
MKTKFNNKEVCHVWASQSQEYGNGSNLSFNGKKLMSYDWHCIGMFINENTVLVRSYSYSSSTSKHINYMHHAIGLHINTIAVKFLPDNRSGNTIDHEKNLNWFIETINECNVKFKTARSSKDYIYTSQLRSISQLTQYCNLFNLEIPGFTQLNESECLQEIEIQKQKVTAKELKRKLFFDNLKENAKPIIEKLESDWLTLATNNTGIGYAGYYFNIEKTLLRLNGNNIETSRGANVPLREGKILFDLINTGKDIKGFRIGNYTVIGINGTLKVGCHEIARDEIKRFAQLMNW